MDNNHRDRTIESLLRRREMDPPQPTDQCVDAESLAAWMEGGLSGEAYAAVEKHAAGCARCQTLLASMARTASDIEVRPWWRSITAKWLVPVAAIATALVVWISVGRERVPSMQPAPSVEAARPASAPETSAAPAVASPPVIAQRRMTPDVTADNASTQRAQSKSAETRARQEVDKKVDRHPSQDDSRLAATLEPKRSAAPQPVAATPPPAAPSAQPANAAPAEAKPAPVSGLAESVGVSREVAAKQRAAGFATDASIEIQSPDPSYRWRILSPGAIERSTDGGTTWSIVDSLRAAARADGTATNVLTAGSAPSRDVCWIVGRAGIVLLSTTGATWQRRPFPESVDLSGVRASSATNAVVTAADGRRFVTIDAGATWNLVK